MLHLKTTADGFVPLLHSSNTFYCLEMDTHTYSITDVSHIHMCIMLYTLTTYCES